MFSKDIKFIVQLFFSMLQIIYYYNVFPSKDIAKARCQPKYLTKLLKNLQFYNLEFHFNLIKTLFQSIINSI